ncbi:MAG TPA: mechanosensitive ion channel family protein [Methylomirabilota bacterium]
MKSVTAPARVLTTALLAGLVLATGTMAAQPGPAPDSERALTPDRVIASLNEVLAWYRAARMAIRAVGTGTVFGREDEQTALAVLRRAFETARAQAAVLAAASAATPAAQRADAGPLAARRAQVNAAIVADQKEVERLQQRLKSAPAARRAALQDELAAATNRLELDRVRLDFMTRLEESKVSSSDTEPDLARQIQTLQESVPELRSVNASSPSATPIPSDALGGGWGSVHRLIELYHARGSLDELDLRTKALERSVGSDLQVARVSMRSVMDRLQGLTADPSPGGSLADGQRQFRELLERSKLLGVVVLSLRDEAALVHRFAGDLQGWKGAIDRERWQVLQALGMGLIGVVIAIAAILIGGMLWRVATMRYVRDAYRRRLLLMARNVVVLTATALVLVFHFASELTALVTGLGFAAAGIAFALQNVILALAGYFSMVAPNGIRVGDRVSLQGPFGYVYGEVLDIGLVRIRLRELEGQPVRSTGRIVVFPNSVVFTGSFFKHPPSEDRGEGPRPVERSAA